MNSNTRKDKRKNTTNKYMPKPKSAIEIKTPHSEKQKKEGNDKTENTKHSLKWFFNKIQETGIKDATNIYLSIAITFFTFVLAGVSIWQILEYNNVSKIENRAYLGIQDVTTSPIIPKDSLIIYYDVLNTGKTPALKVVPSSTIIFMGKNANVDSALNHDAGVLKDAMSRRDDFGFVYGNGTALHKEVSGKRIISLSDSIGLEKGYAAIYILIFIKYYDQFGYRHSTWFCAEFNNHGIIRPYIKYNDAD
jgi:hypothetical protein